MRDHLDDAFNGIITDHLRNFLSNSRALDVRIVKGDNNLNSCYQYVVKDSDKAKLLTIKIYDKILDLIGKKATFWSAVGWLLSLIQNLTAILFK